MCVRVRACVFVCDTKKKKKTLCVIQRSGRQFDFFFAAHLQVTVEEVNAPTNSRTQYHLAHTLHILAEPTDSSIGVDSLNTL